MSYLLVIIAIILLRELNKRIKLWIRSFRGGKKVPVPPSAQYITSRQRRIANAYLPSIPADFQMTPEFSYAFDFMENKSGHVFITGKAGTGKSTLLQYFKKNTKKKIIVIAPTGIAAIAVGGATIHSLFHFPPRLVTRNDVKRLPQKRELFASLDAVVIDEVSMVRADLMDAIDLSLRINRGRPQEPFGGVQMILIGDLYQLPPVVEQGLKEYFSATYSSFFFFSSNILQQIKITKIELQKVFRQSDQKFIELLNKIRINKVSNEDLRDLNQRYNPLEPYKQSLDITLTSTNSIAYGINQSKLDSLPYQDHYYDAIVSGEFDEKSFPTDKHLRLKKSAQIMMVKNDPDKRWVNGALGVIDAVTKGSIRVSLDGRSYQVEQAVWEKIDYEYNREENRIETIVIGSFRQYPVKPSWAITVHKSQGRTFDKVIIDLGNGAFAHGQAYVALSRCRSFEGVHLKSPIKLTDIILDERVADFLLDVIRYKA